MSGLIFASFAIKVEASRRLNDEFSTSKIAEISVLSSNGFARFSNFVKFIDTRLNNFNY